METIIDKFSNIAKVNLLSSDGGVVTESKSSLEFADQVRDSYDYLAEPGDVLGTEGSISELNVSAREIIFEPMLMEKLLATHSPFRRAVSPGKFVFNTAGDLGTAYGNATSAALVGQGETANGVALPFLGWVFRVMINDTMFGEGQIKIENRNTGLIGEYIIPNVKDESLICFLNHVQDFTADSTTQVTYDSVAGTVTGEAGSRANTVDSQYVFWPLYSAGSGTTAFNQVEEQVISGAGSSSSWTLSGTNTVIYAYPLYMTRQLSALIDTLISADRLGELATFIAEGYATVQGTSRIK